MNTPKQIDWEKGYYIGQEFIEDTDTETATIEVSFYSPAVLDSFDFLAPDGKKITGTQNGTLLNISFDQLLSKKLIEALMWGKSDQFIIGYISKYLPIINAELLRQRYSSGHFLVKTFSTLDIYKVLIKVPSLAQEIGAITLRWPQSMPSFPPAKKLAVEKDEIFVRDFIDAGNAYLSGNYDDCIRKAITSVENAFSHYGLKPKSVSKWQRIIDKLFDRKYKFNRIVTDNIYAENLGNKMVSSNLRFLYKLRNKIVHEKFRIRPENGWIAKKAIGTLHYLYQFLGRRVDQHAVDYAFYLGAQFLMVAGLFRGENLDYIKKRHTEKSKPNIIKTPEDLDKSVFEDLLINNREQSIILRNEIPPHFY